MKYFIIAGEASGDLHGSNLVKELRRLDENADIVCWGGDLMKKSGATLLKHYRELAYMGILEVVRNIFRIRENFKICKKQIKDFKPNVLILIDYAGFNLRMAKFAYENNIRVFYYISPKIWAWNQKRAIKIKKYVDHMFTILPFETEFYKKYDYEVDFVGNPLLDSIWEFNEHVDNTLDEFIIENKSLIAIVPGSRKQEILHSLPLMLEMVQDYTDFQFIITGAPGIDESFYEQFVKNKMVKVVFDNTYSIMSKAKAALVTSGTATLEIALFKVPQVVCYKAGNFSYQIAKRLIKVNYISLVNLIMNKEVVTELIQHDFNAQKLKTELNNILFDDKLREQMLSDYLELENKLGGVGASTRAAERIVNYLSI